MDHLAWLLDRFKNSQPVTIPQFAKEFGFINEDDAHQAFSALTSLTDISQEKRKRLQMDYDVWRRNYGQEYWSMDRAAEQLSLGGEHVIKKNVQGFTQDHTEVCTTHPGSPPWYEPLNVLRDTNNIYLCVYFDKAGEVIVRKKMSSTPPHACEYILKRPSTGP
jgi:hypothetical protein